jgi:phosphohistidine swiveling domain-containing protein
MNEQEILNYIKKNDFDIQTAYASYFIATLVFRSYANFDLIKNTTFSPVFSYFNFSDTKLPFVQILDDKKIHNLSKSLYEKYKKDIKSIDRYISKHQELTELIRDVWENFENIKKYNEKYLIQVFEKMTNLADRWWKYGVFLEDKGEVINKEIVTKFAKRKKISESKARELVFSLAHPAEKSSFIEERRKFLNICRYILNNKFSKNNKKEIFKDKRVLKEITEYKKKFFWFKSNFYRAKKITEQSIINDVFKEIKKLGEMNIEKELKQLSQNGYNINKKKKFLLKNIKLTSGEKKDLYFAERVISWVDKRKAWMMEHIFFFSRLMEEIALFLKMDYHEISLYTTKELAELLSFRKKLSKVEIQKRNKETFSVFEKNKEINIYYGDKAKELFQSVYQTNLKEIKGVVASAGRVKKINGVARVVYRPGKDKFKKGEILITSMTRIEFVPIMRMAKAIVTNEGGMACHAAIVSRELNLPAIIGTKNATKEIKSGDKIELDIEKGTIKKI